MGNMLLRSEKVENLEAVPIIAAETVVCRTFKVVDDCGTVRIEATVGPGGNGPDETHLRMFDDEGHLLAHLSVGDRGDGSKFGLLWVGNSDNEESEMVSAS